MPNITADFDVISWICAPLFGSHLCDVLIAEGRRVIADNLLTGREENLAQPSSAF